MKKTIAVLPGDGVGPEIIEAAITVLKAVEKTSGYEFIQKYGLMGAAAIEKTGDPFPIETEQLCKESDAILFGAIGHPKYDNDPSAKVRPEQGLLRMRKSLGLFANIRPIKVYKEMTYKSPLKDNLLENVDFVIIRELTGGIYFGTPRERRNNGELAIDTSIYSKDEVRRIARIAFDLTRKRKKKVTSVDKANVLETSRLWRETVSEVAASYPDVTLEHMFVDNAAMQIIKRPSSFDVLLTENMFGDILTDEASVIAGSIGLLPSASIGEKYALYEPIHGAFNKAAGKNTANPFATILSLAMMLRMSFGLTKEAEAIESAVQKFITQGFRTIDLADEKTDKKKIKGTKETGEIISKLILKSH